MMLEKLRRWSGWIAILAALVLIMEEATLMLFPTAGAMAITTPERVFAVLSLLGSLLLVGGLIGMYLYQMEEAGSFGLVAFLVALAGSALMVCSDWSEVFTGPMLVKYANGEGSAQTVMGVGFMLNFAVYAIGWTLFAIASFRARVFPRLAAVIMVFGIVFVLVVFLAGKTMPGNILPWYAAFGWMGIDVVRQKKQRAVLITQAAAA